MSTCQFVLASDVPTLPRLCSNTLAIIMATNNDSAPNESGDPSAIRGFPDIKATYGQSQPQMPSISMACGIDNSATDTCLPSTSSKTKVKSTGDLGITKASIPKRIDCSTYLKAEKKQCEKQKKSSEIPPYISFIVTAICQSSGKRLRHEEICEYIMKNFPHYIENRGNWTYSVRRTLLDNRPTCFLDYTIHGLGRYWMLNPSLNHGIDCCNNNNEDTLDRPTVASMNISAAPNELEKMNIEEQPKLFEDHPYIVHIATAIYQSSGKMITLQGIFEYIMKTFPDCIKNQQNWKGFVRYTLLYSKVKLQHCFLTTEYPGKGTHWIFHPILQYDLNSYNRNNQGILNISSNALRDMTAAMRTSEMCPSILFSDTTYIKKEFQPPALSRT